MKTVINEQNRRNFVSQVEAMLHDKLSKCYQCGKCSAGCPVNFEMDYTPNQIIKMTELGMDDKVLNSKTIWLCVSCNTCSTRCPKGFEVTGIMDVLREIAEKRGITAIAEKEVQMFHEVFLDNVKSNGRIFELELVGKYKLKTRRLFRDMFLAPKMLEKGKLKMYGEKISDLNQIAKIFKDFE